MKKKKNLLDCPCLLKVLRNTRCGIIGQSNQKYIKNIHIYKGERETGELLKMGKVERQVAKTSESVEGKARSTECILVESTTRSERKHGDTK